MTQWPVSDGPCGMSVSATTTHNVLVTCHDVSTIKEFTAGGDPVRTVAFADDVVNPWHTIQLTCGQFVVCHGGLDDPVHRVCRLDADARVVQSLGGPPGNQINIDVKNLSRFYWSRFTFTLFFHCVFSTLALFVIGRQEEHPACQIECWCGYLSGVRCRLFAYGPAADATASPNLSCLI